MDSIKVKNIRIFTNHGCLEEEMKIGSEYRVDIQIWADLSRSAITDELADTVDYVHLNKIAKEEMNKRSKLLEQVADRMLDRMLNEIPMIHKAKVEVSKINPPIGGDVHAVSIIMSKKRN